MSTDGTLWTANLTALFCALTSALYVLTQTDPPPIVVLFLLVGPLLAAILWMQKDAQRHRVGVFLDWGMFVWLALPVMIPWYALKTRGRRGWLLMLWLYGLWLSPSISWFATAWLVYGIRYALWYYGTGSDAG